MSANGGRIDLLAIAPDGALVLIEIKRDRTPREVVAQALDYASWVEKLDVDKIAAIYGRFRPGRSLGDDFRERFGQALDDESLNGSHEIVLVAGSLDPSSERIVAYLNERNIPINVLCFQAFTHGAEQLLSRAWLLDPLDVQINAATTPKGPKEPWNGEFYCSFGDSETRSWGDAVEHGFISGGGAWFSRTLTLLKAGDRVWVNVPKRGCVGVGRARLSRAAALRVAPNPAPRYDEVFFEGTAQLDRAAGEPVTASRGDLHIDGSIWLSSRRRDAEIG